MNRWTIEPCTIPPDGRFYVISPQGEELACMMPDGKYHPLSFDVMSDAGRVCDLLNQVGPRCVL